MLPVAYTAVCIVRARLHSTMLLRADNMAKVTVQLHLCEKRHCKVLLTTVRRLSLCGCPLGCTLSVDSNPQFHADARLFLMVAADHLKVSILIVDGSLQILRPPSVLWLFVEGDGAANPLDRERWTSGSKSPITSPVEHDLMVAYTENTSIR